MSPLVSTAWLAERLKEPDLRVVDAAWYMPGDPRTGRGEYGREHLPGAVFFDIDAISDHATDLPHMLPSPQAFAEAIGNLGIGEGDRIVVYDHAGLMSAARVWWTFRAMGHREVYVLDGGLPRWKAEDRPVTTEVPTSTAQPFTAALNPALVRDLFQVRAALASGAQVVDARPAGRFTGADPEPRPGLRSGHMPGARSLPWSALVSGDALMEPAQLEAAFRAAGIDPSLPVITTCGSGVTAAVLALALDRLGHPDAGLYDGSWAEWAGRGDTEIVRDV